MITNKWKDLKHMMVGVASIAFSIVIGLYLAGVAIYMLKGLYNWFILLFHLKS